MNFHPPLVSVPIALFSSIIALELLTLTPFGRQNKERIGFAIRFNATVCFFGVIAAFISGYPAGEAASQAFVVPDSLVGDHHLIGRFLLFVSIPWVVLCYCKDLAKVHRNVFRTLYYVLLAAGFLLTGYCGYLGGQLVFSYGAGVRIEEPIPKSAGH